MTNDELEFIFKNFNITKSTKMMEKFIDVGRKQSIEELIILNLGSVLNQC